MGSAPARATEPEAVCAAARYAGNHGVCLARQIAIDAAVEYRRACLLFAPLLSQPAPLERSFFQSYIAL